ncbi:MAG: hypothetical protein ABIQ02_01225 [Saprospiraceae bacterium]
MKKKKPETNAINCKEAVTRFNDFMDNYLKGIAREELIAHISECKHCLERFEFEQMLKTKVSQLSKNPGDKTLVTRIEKMLASL